MLTPLAPLPTCPLSLKRSKLPGGVSPGPASSPCIQAPNRTPSDKLPGPLTAAHPHRPSLMKGMQWQLGPNHRTRMSGREVPHERTKPEEATGSGGGLRGNRRCDSACSSVGRNLCCQRKQIPQAGLSPCGGGIISNMRWQRRKVMCSCPPHGLCRVSRAEQITGRGTRPQDGGLWRPCGGEGTPHLTSRSSPSPSHPGLVATREVELLQKW